MNLPTLSVIKLIIILLFILIYVYLSHQENKSINHKNKKTLISNINRFPINNITWVFTHMSDFKSHIFPTDPTFPTRSGADSKMRIELKIELLFRDWRQAKNEKDLQRMNIDQARRLRAADINTLTPSQRAIIELDDANHFANKLERAETKMAYYQLRIDIANYLLIPANQLNFTNHIFQTQNFNYIQLILSNLKLLILEIPIIDIIILGTLLFKGLIINIVIQFLLIFSGDFLIKRFHLDSKYPKLAKWIHLRHKLSVFYIFLFLIWILFSL